MNIRLKYSMDWRAGIWFEDQLQMNNYSATLSLITRTANQEYQIVAISRLKWFVYRILESTVFVNYRNQDQIRALSQAGIRVTTLPDEPIDQIIGLMLYSKFNAIMEQHIQVTEIDIVSDLGDNVHYLHSDQETTFFDFGTGWWTESDPSHCAVPRTNNLNVVRLQRTPTWKDFDLEWQSSTERSLDTVTTSVVKFQRDEN